MNRLLGFGLGVWVALSSVLFGQAQAAEDEGMQPLVVVSFKGFDELTNDLDYIGQLSDNPDLGGGIEGLLELVTGGQGLESMDRDKPWGLAISSDGIEFQILGFLPIKDLAGFLQTVGNAAGGAEELGDGVWQLNLQGMALCFKQHGDWSYVSLSPDFLKNLPDDPTKAFTPTEAKHDLAAEIHVQNIPELFRTLLVDQIKQMASQSLEQQAEGASPLPPELRTMLLERNFAVMAATMNDLEVVRFGGSIDQSAKQGVADISLVAVEGSELATKMNETAASKSKFSGFIQPDASACMHVHQLLTSKQVEEAKAAVEELRAQVTKQLDGVQLLDEQGVKDRVVSIVNELIDLAVLSSFESGHVDSGMALLGQGPFTLVAGGHNPKAEDLQKLFEKVVNMLETEVGFYGFQMDVAKHKDVRFHSAAVPLPGGEIGDALTGLFGFDIELTFGIGPQCAYLAIGAGGVDKLKQVIDSSESNQALAVPPLQVNLSMAPLLKLLASDANADPNLKTMAAALEAGQDKVTVVGESMPNGMRVHIVGEEGLLKVLPAIVSSVGLPAGIPGF